MNRIKYIDIHCHDKDEGKDVMTITNLFPGQLNRFFLSGRHYFSIGIHPWYVKEYSLAEDIEQIDIYSQYNNCKAIGEIGLDRITTYPVDKQTAIFLKQLKIAEIANKPVIIHCVRAFPELIAIRKKRQIRTPWIIHGFNSNSKIADELLKHDCYLSFGYHLLIDYSHVQQIFKNAPTDRIFLETDDKEDSIRDIYAKAAELKETGINEMKDIINENYNKVFCNK
ncbi:MAG: TatD family hydrolase [Bacteroidales bacterium]|nr:TatD family hydrolase [Bacteroidales bacterium]